MKTADRVLAVLQLFTTEKSSWSVEEAARGLGLPISTAYRYFASLVKVGLLVSGSNGRYMVGSAVVVLDRQTRRVDPLIRAAAVPLGRLAQGLQGPGASLLCRLYGRTVICIDHAVRGPHPFEHGFERGRIAPLFRSATSKAIAAHMSPCILWRCFEEARPEEGLEGQTWAVLRDQLRTIRQQGLSRTVGELEPGYLGLAAPVFAGDGAVLASIGVVLDRRDVCADAEQRLPHMVRAAALAVTRALSQTGRIVVEQPPLADAHGQITPLASLPRTLAARSEPTVRGS